MKRMIFILLILIAATAWGKEFESPMTPYQDNYIITGDREDDQVKFQFSAKYNLFYPFNSGVYFGYTQRSYWRIYDDSSPFVETNYMPEAFFRFESGNNFLKDKVIEGLDFIQISPICHKSNGRDGLDSRSINTYYGQIQLSAGDVFNIGVNVKGFGYWDKAKENKDINDYSKNYEAGIFIKHRSKTVKYLDKEELHFKFSGDPTEKGWYMVEGKFRILSTYVQPKLFFQFREGYDEFMINYFEKQKSFRVGFIF